MAAEGRCIGLMDGVDAWFIQFYWGARGRRAEEVWAVSDGCPYRIRAVRTFFFVTLFVRPVEHPGTAAW